MTPQHVTAVMDDLGGASIDANGWTWGPLRVERGGGIAGHTNHFWIVFPDNSEIEPIGPLHTPAELRAALRRILLWAARAGEGFLALRGPEIDVAGVRKRAPR